MIHTLNLASARTLIVIGVILLTMTLLLTQLASADAVSNVLPSSDGAYTQWNPKSGSTHYTMVDETTCNGKTDYNSTNTVGNRDSYGVDISSIPDGSTITQIDITPCASRIKNGGGRSASAFIDVFYRFEGTDSSDAGNYSLSGKNPEQLATTNFTSLSLNKTGSSTLEIGAVFSSGNRGARLGRIATTITYDPPPLTPPAAPSNLTATTATSTALLAWDDNADNEDGFKVERGTDGVSFSEIDSVGKNSTFYVDSPLSPDTYYYRVRAFNTAGNSDYSNTASTTIP